MKKTFSLLTLCLGLCCVSCYDDTALVQRIEALETTQIASIKEQIDAINLSIADLEATDNELSVIIQALEKQDEAISKDVDSLYAKDNELNEKIALLKEMDAVLDERIAELKLYVNTELSTTKDWTNATFATLEQYNATCDEIAAIKVLIADLQLSLRQSIEETVDAAESSIMEWVNEQLTGYWTIAETQAKLDELKAYGEKELAAIEDELKTATEEITAAYKSEISKAIEDSNGKLSDRINEVNDALGKKISDIEDRLTAIEETLEQLTREFAIIFDDTEIGVVPGGVTSVNYSIVGATEKTTVKAFGQNGWSARVVPDGTDKGTITVTAPDPITDEEIIVLVYDGEFRTIMSTINFVAGIVTPSQTVVEFSAEADTVSVELTSNLNYSISIPEDAQDWLSVVDTEATRAIKTETVSFACTEFIGGIRKATVTFADAAGVPVSTLTFIQQGDAVVVTLDEAGTLGTAIDKSLYRDIKGLVINGPINGTDVVVINKMINLEILDLGNAAVVAGGDAYKESYFTENDVIGDYMFKGATFVEVILPSTITKIGAYAFLECKLLKSVTIPSSVKEIGESAFWDASALKHFTLPEGLESIGNTALGSSEALESLTIPSTVKHIGYNAFTFGSIGEVYLKALPDVLTEVGDNLFDYCSNNVYEEATLYIPEGTLDEYAETDFRRFKNIVEE